MSLRRAVLVGGLLCSSAAFCGEGPVHILIPAGGTLSFTADRSVAQCSHKCIMKFMPSAVARYEAGRIATGASRSVVILEGGVRIALENGGEVQAERMTLNTNPDGTQQLSGDKLRFVNARSL